MMVLFCYRKENHVIEVRKDILDGGGGGTADAVGSQWVEFEGAAISCSPHIIRVSEVDNVAHAPRVDHIIVTCQTSNRFEKGGGGNVKKE